MKNLIYILICCSMIIILSGCSEDISLSQQTEEVFWVKHKGAEMPVWVEGNTASQQFILILHGGPAGSGSLGYNLNHGFSVPLEEQFAVAYWDQRGSGNAKGNPALSTLTLDQFVEDLDIVIDAMKYRYGADINIFLLGNSWGGFLGNAYLIDEERQSKICGWIAIDGQHDFEQGLVYAKSQMLSIAEERLDAGADATYWNRKIEAIQAAQTQNPTTNDHSYLNRLGYQIEYRLEQEKVLTQEFFLESGQGFDYFFMSPHNPIASGGNSQTNQILWDEITKVSLTDALHRIQLPSLIIWGKYDTVTPFQLAEDQFDLISTPEQDKQLIALPTAGHQALKHQTSAITEAIESFIFLHNCNN